MSGTPQETALLKFWITDAALNGGGAPICRGRSQGRRYRQGAPIGGGAGHFVLCRAAPPRCSSGGP